MHQNRSFGFFPSPSHPFLCPLPDAFSPFLPARPAEIPDVPFCHHPAFDFNDEIMADGIQMHVELARRFAEVW